MKEVTTKFEIRFKHRQQRKGIFIYKNKKKIEVYRRKMERAIILNEQNWTTWRFQVSIVLRSRGLYNMVTAKCTKEESDKDQKAQELIVTRVEENILSLLTSCATAYDMWEKLTTVYEAKSKVGIHLLQQKFYNLKYEGPMAKFMAQVEELLHQLKTHGEEISENMANKQQSYRYL